MSAEIADWLVKFMIDMAKYGYVWENYGRLVKIMVPSVEITYLYVWNSNTSVRIADKTGIIYSISKKCTDASRKKADTFEKNKDKPEKIANVSAKITDEYWKIADIFVKIQVKSEAIADKSVRIAVESWTIADASVQIAV